MNTGRPELALARDTPSTLKEAVSVFFSHWSPRDLMLGLAIATTVRVALASWSLADVLLPAAVVLAWPLLEWLVHIHLLHFKPRTVLGIRVDPMNAQRHRAHHLDPWRYQRAFIPVPSLIFIQLAMLSLAAITPWLAIWTTAAMITALGMHYEWVHYLCHIRYCPRSHRYRTLVQNHRRHHFKSEKHWLGVSMLSGDLLMGTAGEPGEVAHSPTVRTIYSDSSI